jgi:hypothetical protein
MLTHTPNASLTVGAPPSPYFRTNHSFFFGGEIFKYGMGGSRARANLDLKPTIKHSTNGTLVPLVPGRVNLNKEKSHV